MEIPEGELGRLAHEGGLFMAGMVFGGCMSSGDTYFADCGNHGEGRPKALLAFMK